MALLSLNSKSPEFSWAIRKNPNSDMQVKNCRQGFLFGWFSNPQTFHSYFREGLNVVSFKRDRREDFEYINTSRFVSPLFVIQTIDEFFRHNIREQVKEDIGGETTLTINSIQVKVPLYIKFFREHIDKVDIEHEELGPKVFNITFKTSEPLHYLLNVVQLFSFMVILTNRDYIHLNTDMVKKYLEAMKVIVPPYFMTYLFKKHCLRKPSAFDEEKILLENNPLYNSIELKFGGTLQNRIHEIRERTPLTAPVLDIGCGEGNYVREFSKANKDIAYMAVDTNEVVLEKSKKVAKRNGMSNIKLYENLDQAIEEGIPEGTNVLLTEVIEHMEKEEAKSLILKILKIKNVKSLLITTPNYEFNQFYPLDGSFRHDDHKYEFIQKEWVDFTAPLVEFGDLEYFEIGDRVNGIPTSFGLKAVKK